MSDPPALPRLPARAAESHKGDFGRALLIGGSRGMAGAISLASMAALRGGAGLVTAAVPDCCLETVAGHEPSYMTHPLPCDEDGRISQAAKEVLERLCDSATCVACGPGIGRSKELAELVTSMFGNISKPMVLDADALLALAQHRDLWSQHPGPRILTPHPGEFRRLLDEECTEREQLELHAVDLAAKTNTVILLKGHRTLITDGHRAVHNTTGNPGMATGGSGDVLTGLITALVCQAMAPFDAAVLGAHMHGLAGDLAAAELGQVSLIAADLVRFLPRAFAAIT